VDSGTASYGISDTQDWEVSFSEGPHATIQALQTVEVALGQPTIKVRAVEDRNRYNRQAAGKNAFKKGTRIFLEPKIVGAGGEVFGRFRQPRQSRAQRPIARPG